MNDVKSFEDSNRIDLNKIAEAAGLKILGNAWQMPSHPGPSWDELQNRQSKDYPVTMIPIDQIEIYDTIQRNREDICNSKILKKMCDKFDSILFSPCRIALYVDKSGKSHLINVDGQGRQVYALIEGFPKLPCIVQKVNSWDEVCTLFFKYNNQNYVEKVKKASKWNILFRQGDKEAHKDYQLISQLFKGGVEMPGSMRTNILPVPDRFTLEDFDEFLKFVSFKEGEYNAGIVMDNGWNLDRKLMLEPYSLMRTAFSNGISFKNWSVAMNVIYFAIKNQFSRITCLSHDRFFSQIFKAGNTFSSLFPSLSQREQSDLNNVLSVFVPTDLSRALMKNIRLKEDYGIYMLILCDKLGMINPSMHVKQRVPLVNPQKTNEILSKTSSEYERIMNTLNYMKYSGGL